jgi:hypothetical protein
VIYFEKFLSFWKVGDATVGGAGDKNLEQEGAERVKGENVLKVCTLSFSFIGFMSQG